MIEIRKTALFAQWLDGLLDLRAGRGSKPGLNGLRAEIPETLRPLARGYRNCALTTAPDTGYISGSEGEI